MNEQENTIYDSAEFHFQKELYVQAIDYFFQKLGSVRVDVTEQKRTGKCDTCSRFFVDCNDVPVDAGGCDNYEHERFVVRFPLLDEEDGDLKRRFMYKTNPDDKILHDFVAQCLQFLNLPDEKEMNFEKCEDVYKAYLWFVNFVKYNKPPLSSPKFSRWLRIRYGIYLKQLLINDNSEWYFAGVRLKDFYRDAVHLKEDL